MSIVEQDLKLFKAERLTDFPDGGGRVTGREVVDGQVNNLFGNISQLDRTAGRVSLRKGFPAVATDNDDTLYGMHVVITDPPDDSRVNVLGFSTEDWKDERKRSLYGDDWFRAAVARVIWPQSRKWRRDSRPRPESPGASRRLPIGCVPPPSSRALRDRNRQDASSRRDSGAHA